MPTLRVRPLSVGSLAALLLLGGASAQAQSAKQRRPPAATSRPAVVKALLEKRLRAPQIVPGQVVVTLTPTAGGPTLAPDWARALSTGARPRVTSGGEMVIDLASAGFSAMAAGDRLKETQRVIAQLKGRADVEYVQANYMLQIVGLTPNDPLYARQWDFADRAQVPGGIGLPSAWARTTGSSGVVVAVIDTGILPHHPDIQGSPNLLPGYDMISDVAVANDGDARDGDPTDPGDGAHAGECGQDLLGLPVPPQDEPSSWHGTHVAGTIGVERSNNGIGTAGINWSARILPVRVLGKCGGSIVDINDAIRWAAGLHVPGAPDNPTPAKVINMSLGGSGACSESPSTQKAIDDAIAAGATIVVAAGNEAEDAAGFMPASCNGVITVAASDLNGRLATRYSNWGARVDIMAPGGDVDQDANHDGFNDGILSLVNGGYDSYNGTSMAAPHVAGVAALLLAQNPTLTPTQILAELRAHAIPRTATECPHPCGAGLLNADFAVDHGAQPTPTTPPSPTPTPTPPKVPALTLSGWIALALLAWLAAARR